MHIVDKVLDRLMPKTAREQNIREDATKRVVQTAAQTRADAQQSMIDAYRRAGIQFATPKRRWDD